MNRESIADIENVKGSYFNLLAAFISTEKTESRYIRCLIKWGIQLGINVDDLKALEKAKGAIPADEAGKLEALYHLVYMIYLDKVVEDIELEVASVYAEKLGFQKGLVGDLFKSIATSRYDSQTDLDVRREVAEFLKLQRS